MTRNPMIDRVSEQADNNDAAKAQQSTSDSEQGPSCSDGDDRSTPVCVTDGGHPTARDIIERRTGIDMTDAVEVKHYPDQSVMSAYRVGDQHIVVTNADKTEQAEINRVQATRAAVLEEEKLWTIPSNWDVHAKIRDDGTHSLLCHLPKRADVVVECPSSRSSTRSRYEVVKTGHLQYELVDIPDIQRMHKAHQELEEQAEANTDLLDALNEIAARWQDFLLEWKGYFNKWGQKAINSIIHGKDTVSLDSWVLDPWDDEQSFLHLLPHVPQIKDHAEEVREFMIEEEVVSLYPRMKLKVRNSAPFTIGYYIEALIELGCTPTEAVDYVLIEQRRRSRLWAESPVAPWADSRGVTEATVRKNIAAAKNRIKR